MGFGACRKRGNDAGAAPPIEAVSRTRRSTWFLIGVVLFLAVVSAALGALTWYALQQAGIKEEAATQAQSEARRNLFQIYTEKAHLAENRRLLRHTTHLEISPCAMLGVVAGSIPYSDHNQVNWGAAECVEEGGRALRTLPPPRRILLTQTYEGYDAS